MSIWFTHPLFLPSLIIVVTIILWATSLLPEFLTALLFFTAAMIAKIAPPEVIFGGFASSAFWLVFSGFVLGVAIRKTGLADRAARALSSRLTDSWPLMVASVVLLTYALAFVMPSNMGRIALLMPIVGGDGEAGRHRRRLPGMVWTGAGGGVWHISALRHYPPG
ncbi:transporter, divalent anion:Na+ symporter (DASS) family [Leclercia adecarboxylata]|uniref:Transporter, divalent anion:Na+ symporter (DASS) family n=1 Tax=Leclercia adecarboxylata TaxID=83655 RepID=A0A4U9IXH8_9ENTR|nr:transporter, divalent anion:Na+ symporter (DASS) family [Leclercia adecarboxylata]